MSSGPSELFDGALEKIEEFRKLRYPESVLQKACAYLGATSGNGTCVDHCQERSSNTRNGPKAGNPARLDSTIGMGRTHRADLGALRAPLAVDPERGAFSATSLLQKVLP